MVFVVGADAARGYGAMLLVCFALRLLWHRCVSLVAVKDVDLDIRPIVIVALATAIFGVLAALDPDVATQFGGATIGLIVGLVLLVGAVRFIARSFLDQSDGTD